MKAAEVVRQGWYQGFYYNASCTAFCAVGAIREATCPGYWTSRAGEATDDARLTAESALNELRMDVGCPVPHWNDEAGRTAEQVAAQMEATAKRLEGEGR